MIAPSRWVAGLLVALGGSGAIAGAQPAVEVAAVLRPGPSPVTRQAVGASSVGVGSGLEWIAQPSSTTQSHTSPAAASPALSTQSAQDSWWAPAASAVVPGAGQFLLRQDRAVGYLAVEIYGWLRFAADLREARRQRSAYQELAATVARAYFSEIKPNGDFAYYERMENFVESGVFDGSADDGVQPETNEETFNGALWLRARSTFWEDPALPPPADSDPFVSAVLYYEERAIRPEFRWSWRDAQLEQDLFRRTIDRSNDAYRRSLQDLGIILANHVLSTVDAYVTLRIRRIGATGQVGVGATIPLSPEG